jgi:hypothetical protein
VVVARLGFFACQNNAIRAKSWVCGRSIPGSTEDQYLAVGKIFPSTGDCRFRAAPRRVPGRANLFAQMGNPLVGPAAPMVNFAP